MVKIYLDGEEQTKEIGYRLGKLLTPGSVICLIGDLGAGKTTMTQSLAKAIGVDDYITSPTFTIVNEYEGNMPLYHFDVYSLGAGKTTMTQSLAKAIGVDDYITSPTFTIVNEYEGNMPLYHFDVYRIGSSEEMYDIGYDEYINSDGVCIIEWANLIEDILPNEYLDIELSYKDMGREMILKPVGEKYKKIVEELTK